MTFMNVFYTGNIMCIMVDIALRFIEILDLYVTCFIAKYGHTKNGRRRKSRLS